jgi:hypothetical protein
MKLISAVIIVLVIASACGRSDKDRMAQHYKSNRDKLVQEKTVHDFLVRLSYFPAAMLPGEGRDTAGSYYYFRLTVDINKPATSAGDRSALYYGIDSLFATGEGPGASYPLLVEPVMNGNNQKMEYLLVFDKAAFKNDKNMRIIFFDRLFTNTKMVFEFDRNNIEEIESIS